MKDTELTWEEIHKHGTFDELNLNERQKTYLALAATLISTSNSTLLVFLLGLFGGDADKVVDTVQKTGNTLSKIAEFLEMSLDEDKAIDALILMHSIKTTDEEFENKK